MSRRVTEELTGNTSFSRRPCARRADRPVMTSAAEFQKITRVLASTAITASGSPASTLS